MKKLLMLFGAVLLMASGVQASIITTSLDLPTAANTASGTVVTTSQSYGGATFDISYTISAIATGANPFIGSNGTLIGVGSDADIVTHYNTLEGDDNEGISFTNLTVSNFVAGSSGLTISDLTDLKFVSFTLGAAGNAQDGVNISFTAFGSGTANVNLSNKGATPTIDLTALSNYPASPTLATGFFLEPDNNASSNRWNVSAIGVSYAIPEPTTVTILALVFGCFLFHRLRRRRLEAASS